MDTVKQQSDRYKCIRRYQKTLKSQGIYSTWSEHVTQVIMMDDLSHSSNNYLLHNQSLLFLNQAQETYTEQPFFSQVVHHSLCRLLTVPPVSSLDLS